ncbi:esterase family protein [Echinimonas agarilytica]|uniref:Alpha/beta hydrolase-fold protein n=1 Tax=Echinimonas agarilytica TaxID=1215918 RepID=A0AA41W7G6_9GAMM|nr:alpha/beta hydrolase-fold protein [Echinimonas agarilytica]MCM2680057.1 alpha/beta hydrolase-fold protein [Echinimonas agarilytica]
MKREYHKWWSNRLHREMELLVFGHSGDRMLVFPTRNARFYEYENMRMIEALQPKIEAGRLQVFCVDSIDCESLYANWAHPSHRIGRHLAYEEYILNEVFPLMDCLNPGAKTISHGCSLGAYHAANMVFKHPHLFQRLIAFSGRYDLTEGVEWFADLFGGFYDDNIYFNTPLHFLPNLECENRLRSLRETDMTFVIGEQDPFRANNERLSQILWQKNVPHDLKYWEDRAHRGYYWRRMAPVFI